jgi:hypothetical protein
MTAVKPVDRLSGVCSMLAWSFILSTVLVVLCRLWLNYYEGRMLPIGPGDRELTLAVFQACVVISVCSLAGLLTATALRFLKGRRGATSAAPLQ